MTGSSEQWQPAVIAFGANLGNRAKTLFEAVHALASDDRIRARGLSALYESVALKVDGFDAAAPRYLNGVLLLETVLSAPELLSRLHEIETVQGRQRTVLWGDRTLDLDLIDFAGQVFDQPMFTLPHPRAWQRDFVLRPWFEIDKDAVLPGRGRVADLLAALAASSDDGGTARLWTAGSALLKDAE